MINRLIFMILLCIFSQSAKAQVKVIDGDSLEIGDRRIRLDGIDAPELVQTCFTASGEEYACGKEALTFIEGLVKDKPVDCICLPEKDRYGRELCECFVEDTSLNKTLMQSGWAMSYRDTKFDEWQNDAEAHKRGIWQGKFMRPALFRALERATEQKSSD